MTGVNNNNKVNKCDCGAAIAGGLVHSDWCSVSNKNKLNYQVGELYHLVNLATNGELRLIVSQVDKATKHANFVAGPSTEIIGMDVWADLEGKLYAKYSSGNIYLYPNYRVELVKHL